MLVRRHGDDARAAAAPAADHGTTQARRGMNIGQRSSVVSFVRPPPLLFPAVNVISRALFLAFHALADMDLPEEDLQGLYTWVSQRGAGTLGPRRVARAAAFRRRRPQHHAAHAHARAPHRWTQSRCHGQSAALRATLATAVSAPGSNGACGRGCHARAAHASRPAAACPAGRCNQPPARVAAPQCS